MPKTIITVSVPLSRMLSKTDAAHYCGLPSSRFINICPIEPIEHSNGAKRWDIRDLDQWLDELKSADMASDDALLSKLG